MSSRIISFSSAVLNPDDICSGTCETCLHWNTDRNRPVYAKIGTKRVQVAQCLCDGDDRAPYADTCGAESVVFTQADTTCAAYEIHPETLADMEASFAHYAELDRQLTADAWM